MIGWAGRGWSRRRVLGGAVLLGGLLTLVAWSLVARSDSWPVERTISRPVNPLYYRPDGQSLVVSLRDKNGCAAMDLATGAERVIPASEMVWAPWISPDGRLALAQDWGGTLRVSEVTTGTEVRRLASGPSPNTYPVFASDGQSVLIFCGTPQFAATVQTWDLATGAVASRPLTAPFGRPAGTPASLTWLPSPDGRTLAYPDAVGGIQLWDVATDRPAGGVLRTPTSQLNYWPQALVFTPDSRFLLHGQPDGRVEVWNVARRALDRVLAVRSPDDFVDVLLLSPNGRTLLVHTYPDPQGYLEWGWRQARRTFSTPDQREDDGVVLLDLASGQRLARASGGMWAAFSPDSQRVVLRHPDRITIHRVPHPEVSHAAP